MLAVRQYSFHNLQWCRWPCCNYFTSCSLISDICSLRNRKIFILHPLRRYALRFCETIINLCYIWQFRFVINTFPLWSNFMFNLFYQGPLPLVFTDALFRFHPDKTLLSKSVAYISLYLLGWSPIFWIVAGTILNSGNSNKSRIEQLDELRKRILR